MDKNIRVVALKVVTVGLIAVPYFAFPGWDWRHVMLLAAQLVVVLI